MFRLVRRNVDAERAQGPCIHVLPLDRTVDIDVVAPHVHRIAAAGASLSARRSSWFVTNTRPCALLRATPAKSATSLLLMSATDCCPRAKYTPMTHRRPSRMAIASLPPSGPPSG